MWRYDFCYLCALSISPSSISKGYQIILQIEVEAVDRTGTFIGSLWESKTNMSSVLLEAGLAKINSFALDRIPDANVLTRAEKSAKQQKLKVNNFFIFECLISFCY
jgi:hypothetical protein